MTKQRGSPYQRGMGSESDPISERFAPSEQHRQMQLKMAHTLLTLGTPREKVAHMLSLPLSLLEENQ